MKKHSLFSPFAPCAGRTAVRCLSLLFAAVTLSSCGIVSFGRTETLPSETVPVTERETGTVTGPETDDPGFRPAETGDGEAADRANLESLPAVDLGGVLFRVVTSKQAFYSPDAFDAEETSADPVDTAKHRRNRAVADRYHVLLTYYEIPEDRLCREVKEASYAESYIGDLIEIEDDGTFAVFAAGGVTVNLLSLPHTDYGAPYFDPRSVAQCSAGNRMYAVCGEANRDIGGTYCVFWNKDLTGEEDLFVLVREGGWTWEKLLSLSAEAAPLANASLPAADYLALACSGSNLLRTGVGLLPEAGEDTENVEEAVILARTLLSCGFRPAAESVEEDLSESPSDAFRAGKAAFYIGEARELFDMNAPGLHWGVLPLPKVSAEQETYPSLQSRRTLFTAISSMASHDNTGYLLQALNAASGNEMREAFLAEALTDAVSASDDIWMLRRIWGSQFFDFGWLIACDDYNSVAKASCLAFQSAVTSDRTFSYYYEAAKVALLYWNPINFPL